MKILLSVAALSLMSLVPMTSSTAAKAADRCPNSVACGTVCQPGACVHACSATGCSAGSTVAMK